jgi:hypothetical protein
MSEQFGDEISNEPRVPRRNKLVAWSTLGVLGAAAAAGGIYAAVSGSPASSASTSGSGVLTAASSTAPSAAPPTSGNEQGGPRGRGGAGGPWMRGPGGPAMGGMFGIGGPGRVLHGESTVATANGGTEIVDTQSGTVSAIDTTKKTVTVTSTDKVAFTYVVDSSSRIVDFATSTPAKATLADLKVGDTVEVTAIRSGDTRTVKALVDGKPAPGTRGGHGPQAPAASPKPSSTASGTSA